MKITHKLVYRINKDCIFKNVNSYSEMIDAIYQYGGKDSSSEEYRNNTCAAFEIFNQFWMLKFGEDSDIGVYNIKDTSSNSKNRGYDFTFTDKDGLLGIIQTKFRNIHSSLQINGKLNCILRGDELLTNDDEYSDIIRAYPDQKPRCKNNILFINFDETNNLFDSYYSKRNKPRYVIDRRKQEFYINNDNNFWRDFRDSILESSEFNFVNAPTQRDVQDWIRNGVTKMDRHELNPSIYRDITYLGTKSVIRKDIPKGRVEAAPATGKTLVIHNDCLDVFNDRNLVILTIPWRPLITQTFSEFYKWKMFGYNQGDNIIDSNIVPILAMSGDTPKYNEDIIGKVLMTTNIDEIAGKIISNREQKKKTLLFITDKSLTNEYDDKAITRDNYEGEYAKYLSHLTIDNIKDIMNFESLFGILFKNGFKPDDIFEIYDEFHNLIPTIANGTKDSKNREELKEYAERLLINMSSRNSGTLFYSASNKTGTIIDSFNPRQFGPLLCKVSREELRQRGYVCPFMPWKIIEIKTESSTEQEKRDASISGLDIRKAYNEAVSIIRAFNDLKKNYYKNPNLLTFGSHVAGCKFIASDENFKQKFEESDKVKLHYMSSETPNSKRQRIFEEVGNSGNNIINQHSVAQEGVNMPNLHSSLLDRSMGFNGLVQSGGRTDRTPLIDTINLQKGIISLDSPEGWEKPYNVRYLEINDNENMRPRIKELLKYIYGTGIPKDKCPITYLQDDSRTNPNNSLEYKQEVNKMKFKIETLNELIESCSLEIMEEAVIEEKAILKSIINNTESLAEKMEILVDYDMSDVIEDISKIKSSGLNIDENILQEIDLGSFINHAKFGNGMVIDIKDTILTIDFDNGKTKTIDSKFAPIKIC